MGKSIGGREGRAVGWDKDGEKGKRESVENKLLSLSILKVSAFLIKKK